MRGLLFLVLLIGLTGALVGCKDDKPSAPKDVPPPPKGPPGGAQVGGGKEPAKAGGEPIAP